MINTGGVDEQVGWPKPRDTSLPAWVDHKLINLLAQLGKVVALEIVRTKSVTMRGGGGGNGFPCHGIGLIFTVAASLSFSSSMSSGAAFSTQQLIEVAVPILWCRGFQSFETSEHGPIGLPQATNEARVVNRFYRPRLLVPASHVG